MWHWHVMMVDVVMSWELSILIPEILKRVNFEYTKSWEFQIDLKVSKFRMLNPQIKIIFLRIWASYILKFQDWGSWILNFKKGVIFEDLSILYPELSGFRILKSSKITPFSILRVWKSWLYITWRPKWERMRGPKPLKGIDKKFFA